VRALAAAAVLVALAAAGPASAQALRPFDTQRLYLTEQAFAAAIRPYQQAIQANANNATAQYWLGYAYLVAYRQYLTGLAPYAAGYLAQAERPLSEAIRINPRLVEAYVALQHVYHLRGDDARAEEVVLKMMAQVRPKHLPTPKEQVDGPAW
jgi:tetratricopeptide (TPR) repeat protein